MDIAFVNIPDDVHFKLLAYIPPWLRFRLRETCKRFQSLCENDCVWTRFDGFHNFKLKMMQRGDMLRAWRSVVAFSGPAASFHLRKGITLNEIKKMEERFGLQIPQMLAEFHRCHDGENESVAAGFFGILGEMRLLSLEECLVLRFERAASESEDYFPLTTQPGFQKYICDWNGCVLLCTRDDFDQRKVADSLVDFLQNIVS